MVGLHGFRMKEVRMPQMSPVKEAENMDGMVSDEKHSVTLNTGPGKEKSPGMDG